MIDTPRVLVAYATAANSTAGIAERIAQVLRSAGFEVLCWPAGPHLDPAGFEALVLGSAVHNMAWLPRAADLLRRAAASGNRPVWCFSVGGVNPCGRFTSYVTRLEAERVARQFPAGFAPRDHQVFGGVVEFAGVPLWSRLGFWLMGGRGGDHRDWPAVEAWATQIAVDLARMSTPGAGEHSPSAARRREDPPFRHPRRPQ